MVHGKRSRRGAARRRIRWRVHREMYVDEGVRTDVEVLVVVRARQSGGSSCRLSRPFIAGYRIRIEIMMKGWNCEVEN